MNTIENPSQYIGRSVSLRRGEKIVEVFLYKIGDGPHYKGSWVMPDGKPMTTIVPFAEVAKQLIAKSPV